MIHEIMLGNSRICVRKLLDMCEMSGHNLWI